MTLGKSYKQIVKNTALFFMIFASNIYPAQMSEVEFQVKLIFQKYQDWWMELHKGQKCEYVGSISIKFTLSENGEVQNVTIERESNLPARFKVDLITEVGNLKFNHKEGEPNIFTYSGTFN